MVDGWGASPVPPPTPGSPTPNTPVRQSKRFPSLFCRRPVFLVGGPVCPLHTTPGAEWSGRLRCLSPPRPPSTTRFFLPHSRRLSRGWCGSSLSHGRRTPRGGVVLLSPTAVGLLGGGVVHTGPGGLLSVPEQGPSETLVSHRTRKRKDDLTLLLPPHCTRSPPSRWASLEGHNVASQWEEEDDSREPRGVGTKRVDSLPKAVSRPLSDDGRSFPGLPWTSRDPVPPAEP